MAETELVNSYGYIPSGAAAISFLALFSLTAIVHVYQTIKSRYWFTVVFSICAIGEIAGWAGRYYSSQHQYNDDAFLDQIALILAPNLAMAGLYYIFSIIVFRLGSKYALLRPRLYPIIFICFDLISLVVQGTGGGMAAAAEDSDQSDLGAWIMFGGVVFQFLCLSVFVFLALNYAKKASRDLTFNQIGSKFKWLCFAMAISTGALLVRAAYRAAELGDGWDSYIMTHEYFFIFLDGVPVIICLGVINLAHPLYTMPPPKNSRGESEEAKELSSYSTVESGAESV